VQDERRVHIHLTAAGRKLKAKAAKVPACVLAASQCSIPELVQLTRQVRELRDRLVA
jgi:DNA-binding MarR family transcriptional regulator